MRYLRTIPFLLVTAFLLTSCNIYQVLPRADLNVSVVGGTNLSDIMIGVKLVKDEKTGVTTTTYVIPEVVIKASARPGSIGVNLSDYSLEYFDPNGKKIETASTTSKGTLNMNVAAGVLCKQTPISQCTLTSADSYYAQGAEIQSTSFSAMDGDILDALIALPNDADGSYALIVINGVDTNGNAYSYQLEPVRVIFRIVS